MRVWLVTIGEPVPVQDRTQDRLHRTGYLADFLGRSGHDVTWWTSAFDHFRKEHLYDQDTVVQLAEHVRIRLLRGCGYKNNLSLARIRDHRQVAGKFAKLARREAVRPDVMLASLPTIELCAEAVRFGREHGVPVVLDMRDMWPDVLVDSVPGPARPIARLGLHSMFRDAHEACAGATAITGITEAFVEWGLRRGGRQRSRMDRSFPMGYVSRPPAPDRIREAERIWDERGITASGAMPVACFIGTLGRQADIETVIKAARRLRERGRSLQFVLCGTGDRLEYYRKMAVNDPNVLFPGWIDAAGIHVLMRRSMVGIDPLPTRYDFLSTINNKAIEYMSAGLPVVSSPNRGVLCDLLLREECGLVYADRDPEGLASLLSGLLDDPEAHRRMARNSARVFREMFTAEKVYADMTEYLQEIGNCCGRGRKHS